MTWDWEKLNEQQQKQKNTKGSPPQMEDFLKQIKKFKLPGNPALITIIVLLVLVLGSYSIFFTVESGSVGVVQRLGKFVRTAQPGLNFRAPFGIETVKIVRQDRILKEEFGLSSADDPRKRFISDTSQTSSVSLMLTGDLNVAVVPWIVQYRINDPYNYLFRIRDPKSLLRDLSEASMRMVIGDRSINEVISKRDEIAGETKELLQLELDHAHAGIKIETVEMKKTNVPVPVQPSFNEVNQATQKKEQLIYEAKEGYNKVIPAAKGQAERTIKSAEGYALDRVNRAKGDAARFEAQYSEFVKAKDITKRRMYLEAMSRILPKVNRKIIIDSEQKNILPLLNLNNFQNETKSK